MELDINELLIEELKNLTRGVSVNFSKLKADYSNLRLENSKLETEQSSIEVQMGWRERNLMGFLGGNRNLVKKFNLINSELDQVELNLNKLVTETENQSNLFNKEIAQFLFNHSSAYQKTYNESKQQSKLLKSTKAYDSLLKKVKQGIVDALVWTSWDKLIKHPRANKELSKFRKETSKYQNSLSFYEANSEYRLGESFTFEKYIKFSSEHIAMENFNRISRQVNKYRNHSSKHLKQTRESLNGMISKLRIIINS
jgi:hypothetical protein